MQGGRGGKGRPGSERGLSSGFRTRDRASDPNWGLRAHWQALSLRLAEWFFGRAFGLGFGVVKPLGAGESRLGLCNYVELIDPTFRGAGGVD